MVGWMNKDEWVGERMDLKVGGSMKGEMGNSRGVDAWMVGWSGVGFSGGEESSLLLQHLLPRRSPAE